MKLDGISWCADMSAQLVRKTVAVAAVADTSLLGITEGGGEGLLHVLSKCELVHCRIIHMSRLFIVDVIYTFEVQPSFHIWLYSTL